jgi:cation transport ATPase
MMSMSIAKLTPMFETGSWLITFVTLGKYLEAYARGETAGALCMLMKLQPVSVMLAVLPREVVVELNRIDRTTMTGVPPLTWPWRCCHRCYYQRLT